MRHLEACGTQNSCFLLEKHIERCGQENKPIQRHMKYCSMEETSSSVRYPCLKCDLIFLTNEHLMRHLKACGTQNVCQAVNLQISQQHQQQKIHQQLQIQHNQIQQTQWIHQTQSNVQHAQPIIQLQVQIYPLQQQQLLLQQQHLTAASAVAVADKVSIPIAKLKHRHSNDNKRRRSNDKKKKFTCQECSTTFTLETNLTRHIKKFHKHLIEIPNNIENVPNSNSDDSHVVTPKVVNEFTCKYCDINFKNDAVLQKHIIKIHPKNKTIDMHHVQKEIKHGGQETMAKKFICQICEKKFAKNPYLKAHIKNIHNTFIHECKICNKGFQVKASLEFHNKEFHGIGKYIYNGTNDSSPKQTYNTNLEKLGLPECPKCKKIVSTKRLLKSHLIDECGYVQCSICKGVYTSDKILKQHVRRIHFASKLQQKTGIKLRKTNIICTEEGCVDIGFPTLKAFRNHLVVIHEKKMITTEHEFSSTEDINDWKDRIEKENSIGYVTMQGFRKCNNKEYLIFHCRRSGIYKETSATKRSKKAQGTCKIGRYCSSAINVVITNGAHHKVTYYETHSGHELDVLSWCHFPIPASDRLFLAEKLAQKVPKEELLNMTKNWEGRSSLIKHKDLINIEKQYGLHDLELFDIDEIRNLLKKHLGKELLQVKEQE
ncbi:unnamed protein product [Meganyctiphanes norvegica]|uniref:C2H2-type domain-containing protein n=1 Tax=Meganyctiphanes norvegica TaxID=48144 RepID=A0AAV2RVH4_MEGNR